MEEYFEIEVDGDMKKVYRGSFYVQGNQLSVITGHGERAELIYVEMDDTLLTCLQAFLSLAFNGFREVRITPPGKWFEM